MPNEPNRLTGWARLLAAGLLLAAGAIDTAGAQNLVALVNGEPITAIDIEQRSKFEELTSHKVPPRQKVLDDLIDEILKVKEAKRWGIDVPQSDVDSSYAAMAGRMRFTPEQLTQSLTRSGISPNTLKSRIRADIAWQGLVRGRYQASLQVGEKDIAGEMESKNTNETGYEYIMRPILFIVPPGSPDSVIEGRRKEAEALRTRFKSCEEGVAMARQLRDVAVRTQITRTTADLNADLRRVLDSVPVGQLTAPEVSKLGVEMFAICAKNETKSDTLTKREARDQVFAKRFEETSKRYLQSLRRSAMIEYK